MNVLRLRVINKFYAKINTLWMPIESTKVLQDRFHNLDAESHHIVAQYCNVQITDRVQLFLPSASSYGHK